MKQWYALYVLLCSYNHNTAKEQETGMYFWLDILFHIFSIEFYM